MRIDSQPIRDQARREYEKALRDLQKAREQLKHFQTVDQPRFQRWFYSEFGALLSQLRETHQQILDKQLILEEVEEEIIFYGVSPWRALRRVLERREPDEPEAAPDPEPKTGSHHRTEQDRDFYEADPGSDRRSGDPRASRNHHLPGAARLKELYRKLVRKLHPDVCPGRTAQQVEWWHQVQLAYERREVESLEVVLTFCEMEERGGFLYSSLAGLLKLTAKLKQSLRQLRSQLAACRREPAWNFARRADLPLLAERLRIDLEEELGFSRGELRRLDDVLARLGQAASRRSRSRRRPAAFDPLF